MQFFQTNLEALQTTNPHLAQRLLSIIDVSDFEIFMDENDLKTLNFVHTKHFIPLYEGSVSETIQTQYEEYEAFAKHPYLYIYGIANGALLKHLLSNQTHQRILVVEPELELLYVVLHMIDFAEDIQSGRLVLLGVNRIEFASARTFFSQHVEQKYAKIYELRITTSYYEKLYHEDIIETNRAFLEALYHAINAAGNDAKDALIGLKHHIFNLPKVITTPTTIELLNKLRSAKCAVLVSTGPSLTKQLPLLKEIAPYVRIIAVDASFPVLYKAGIKPDVVVSMERVKESARFFQQVPKDAYEDVVIALSSLQHKEVLDSIKGGTLQISLRPLGYMIATGPKEWGYLGIGSSAANMGFELIYYSGIKKCILIGQDLAYGEDGKSHASGHVFGEENVKTKESDIWVEGWGGTKKVRTNHDWTMFRNFFEKDLADIKDSMLTINATEGGARIRGAAELPFAQAIKEHVDKSQIKKTLDLQKKSDAELRKIFDATQQQIQTIFTYVSALLEDTKRLFLELAESTQRGDDVAMMEELLEKVQQLKARQNEELYDKVVWHIAQAMMMVQEIDIAPIEVYISQDQEIEKERLKHLIEVHKKWLFSFAGIMDAILKTIQYAQARGLIDTVEAIDVYVANQKIDSFTCHDLQPQNGRVFDVDMRGILYDVPDAHQERIDEVVFRDAKNAEELPRAFVDVIRRDDVKYNELSFMRSLELDRELSQLHSCQERNIGFLATEEDLDDTELMAYFLDLLNKIEEFELRVFAFDSRMIQRAKIVFSEYEQRVRFFTISDIAMLIENVNAFVVTHKTALNYKIFALLREKTDVVVVHFNETAKEMSVGSVKEIHLQHKHPLFSNPEYFGFTQNDIENSGMSIHKTLYEKFLGSIDESENLYEFAYIRWLENVLKNRDMRDFVVKHLKAEYKYANSRT